jgi:hypothetical protein
MRRRLREMFQRGGGSLGRVACRFGQQVFKEVAYRLGFCRVGDIAGGARQVRTQIKALRRSLPACIVFERPTAAAAR